MNPIPMSRNTFTAVEHALDHVRRAASAAGCVPGAGQDVARRLRAEQAVLERLIEFAVVRPPDGETGMTGDNEISEITPGLAQGLETLRLGAQRCMAHALARLPAAHRQQIQDAVEARQCALTLQIDLPAYDVRVMADGPGWLKPQVLFALERTVQSSVRERVTALPPNWAALATASLPPGDRAELRFDIAADNFLAALGRTVEALERHDLPELAELLRGSFSRAFSQGARDE